MCRNVLLKLKVWCLRSAGLKRKRGKRGAWGWNHGCARWLTRATLANKSISTRYILESCPGEERNCLVTGPLCLDKVFIHTEIWASCPLDFDTAAGHEAILPQIVNTLVRSSRDRDSENSADGYSVKKRSLEQPLLGASPRLHDSARVKPNSMVHIPACLRSLERSSSSHSTSKYR